MATDRYPYHLLILSASSKFPAGVSALLPAESFSIARVVTGGSEARRLIGENSDIADIIVIDAPLPDEFGAELATTLIQQTNAGILLLVKNELYDQINHRVSSLGVMVLPKPVNRATFRLGIDLLCAQTARLRQASEQRQKLEAKLEEVRIVGRAKCLLMERMKLSEAEAHRYIEKQSMNNRKTKTEFSKELLRLYLD